MPVNGQSIQPVGAVTVQPPAGELSLSRLFHMHAIAETGQFCDTNTGLTTSMIQLPLFALHEIQVS